jgi:hypothetical protein
MQTIIILVTTVAKQVPRVALLTSVDDILPLVLVPVVESVGENISNAVV